MGFIEKYVKSLWSVFIVKGLPYGYGLKWLTAQCIAVYSCLVVDLLLSTFVNVSEAYATGRSNPSCDWFKGLYTFLSEKIEGTLDFFSGV